MPRPSAARRTMNKWGEGARLREEITDAAIRLLAQANSRDAVTLRSIAREAGVAAPSIYRHFADRDAVLDAVVSTTFEQLERICADAFASADTGADRIRAISYAYAVFATEHRAEYRSLFERSGHGGPDPHRYPAGIRAFQYFIDAFEQRGGEAGAGRADPVRDAQALWAALHGVVTLVPATPGFPWEPARDLIDRLIDGLAS